MLGVSSCSQLQLHFLSSHLWLHAITAQGIEVYGSKIALSFCEAQRFDKWFKKMLLRKLLQSDQFSVVGFQTHNCPSSIQQLRTDGIKLMSRVISQSKFISLFVYKVFMLHTLVNDFNKRPTYSQENIVLEHYVKDVINGSQRRYSCQLNTFSVLIFLPERNPNDLF